MDGRSCVGVGIVNERRSGTPRVRRIVMLARSLKPRAAFLHNLVGRV